MIVIEFPNCYETMIHSARRATEEEKQRFTKEWRDYVFIGTDEIESIALPFVGWQDQPERDEDGAFPGAGNKAYIITDAEADYYIALNQERAEAKAAEEKAERKIDAEHVVKMALAQCHNDPDKLPTPEEAQLKMKAYNDRVNEGVEGYVPHVYSIDEYRYAMQILSGE